MPVPRVTAIRSPDLRTPDGDESVRRLRPRDAGKWAVKDTLREGALPPETWEEDPATEAKKKRRANEKRRDEEAVREAGRRLREDNRAVGRVQALREDVRTVSGMVDHAEQLAKRARGAGSSAERKVISSEFKALRGELDRAAGALGRGGSVTPPADEPRRPAAPELDPELRDERDSGLGLAELSVDTPEEAAKASVALAQLHARLGGLSDRIEQRWSALRREVCADPAAVEGVGDEAPSAPPPHAPSAQEARARTLAHPEEATRAQANLDEDAVAALVW